MLRQWRFWLGLITSVVFLALAFRNQDLAAVWTIIGTADYRYLVPAVAIYFVGVFIRTLRWQTLLAPVRRVSATALFPFVVIGYMANNVLPARTGELVRSYTLSVREDISKSASLATIAVERIFDGLTLIGFILTASLLIQLNAQVQFLTLVASAIFTVLLAGLMLYVAFPRLQRLLFAPVRIFLPVGLADRLEKVAQAFILGLSTLRSRSALTRVVATSVGAWLCEAAMYLIVGAAFDFNLSWSMALLTTAVANLFTLLPSSPGYIGIFEAGVLAVLVGLLGFPEAEALSYALLLHTALWLPVTLLGVLFWSRESLSWADLKQLRSDKGQLRDPRLTSSSHG